MRAGGKKITIINPEELAEEVVRDNFNFYSEWGQEQCVRQVRGAIAKYLRRKAKELAREDAR